jgi:uncharacterized membrane protein (UPF0127 family)
VAWLVRGDDVLASAEIADSFGQNLKGLLGRDGVDGALVFMGAGSVHTFGMRFAIDVAFCDRDFVVLDTITMKRNRVCLPRRGARRTIEAEAGAFERWGLRKGDQLEIRE